MSEPAHVFLIGDSISIDYGPHLAEYLGEGVDFARKEGEAEARSNLDRAVGANGGDSARVLAYLEQLERRDGFRPDLLLINCGLHDCKIDRASGSRQVDIACYRRHLEGIAAAALRLARSFVWINTTPVDDTMHDARRTDFTRRDADVQAYNQAAAEIMARHGVAILPLDAFTRRLGSGPAIFRDGVHFLPAVKQLQAAYLAGWIQQRLQLP